ncbi:MAG: penicillin-binding protein 1A, partial [Candidatus Zixiibacteriota bacterium]
VMVDLMRSVVDNGTGVRARWMGFNRPAGGKTGTSDNFCDNWFIGYTPQITAGCWVGFDDKTSLGKNQDGAKNGVPIWAAFMMKAHDSLPVLDFEEPDGIARADVCLESGELATERCEQVRIEVFIEGSQPTSYCHLHPARPLHLSISGRRPPKAPKDTTDDRVHF